MTAAPAPCDRPSLTPPRGSTIGFSVTGTIALTSGALTIARDLDIEGPGPDKPTVSGNQTSRVFFIQSGTATLAGMTTANGLANGSAPDPPSGGGVPNAASATLTLSHDILSANRALGDASRSIVSWQQPAMKTERGDAKSMQHCWRSCSKDTAVACAMNQPPLQRSGARFRQ